MKTLNKAVIAAAVAAALTPVASQADTTLFGYIDIAVGIENADNTTLAIEDSPAVDNIIGIEGEQELENGDAITYQYIANINPANGGNAFGANYHAFVGYKSGSNELRLGTLDLPLRLALDKADLFAGTYADQNNIISLGDIGAGGTSPFEGAGVNSGNIIALPGNTTAPNTLMLLGGNDTISYAVSASTTDEDSNNADTGENIIAGGLVDVNLAENISVAAGFQHLKDIYSAYGASTNIGLLDALEFTFAVNHTDLSGGAEVSDGDTPDIAPSGFDVTEYVYGVAFNLTEKTTLKAQHAERDISGNPGDNEANMFAVGVDHALSDSVTVYALYTQGDDDGLVSTQETENGNGDASVTAAGIQVSF